MNNLLILIPLKYDKSPDHVESHKVANEGTKGEERKRTARNTRKLMV
jgi:hypothetical protein